jgi:hypothetical protein
MINYINLSKSPIRALPYLTDEAYQDKFNKGWSYSSAYHFSEIRNIYILIRKFGYKDLKSFSQTCISNKLPTKKTPWNERRILENINALKNFGLLSYDNKPIREDVFETSNILDPVTDLDLAVFEEIFFSYHRFREILSWFIDPDITERDEIVNSITKDFVVTNSKPIFPFSTQPKLTDSFIYQLEDNVDVYRFRLDKTKSIEEIMRFWDVFIGWALSLNLIEKFNLTNLDIQLSNSNRPLSCVYFKKAIDPEFNLMSFIETNYKSKYINIPKLILKIAIQFRYSISDIGDLIIKTSKENSDKISLQRTSEIFIRDTEINFVPKVNDSYISHLLIN